MKKWRDGRRGVDGWGKYTRRRKWLRNAELVEDHTDELPAELSAEVRTKPESQANPEVVITDEDGNQRVENNRLLHTDGGPNTNGMTNENGEKRLPPQLPKR